MEANAAAGHPVDRPLPRKGRRSIARSAARLGLALSSVLVALLAGELALRAYLAFKPARLAMDETLGWRSTESVVRRETVRDARGEPYPVVYTTDEHGFRVAGAVRPRRKKVLVLGDSFTQAVDASDDATYYAVLARALGVRVFAHGTGGYGTLQELMVLDRWVDSIGPDLVLLQLCTNDFVNNDLELERRSRWNNNGWRRPYLGDDGRVFYAVPKASPPWFFELASRSKLLGLAANALDRVAASEDGVEAEIEAQKADHPGFQRSARVTERLLRSFVARAGRSRVVAFCSDRGSPYLETFGEISRRVGLEVVDVQGALEAAERSGIVTLAADHEHWSERGHEVVGVRLAEYLGQTHFPE